MNHLRYIFLWLLAAWLVTPAAAQTHKDTLKLNRPVPKVYKFNDNLYWGMTVGTSYSMSEYARKQPFFTMLGPTVDFEFGKHFNKWFAPRVMLGYHMHRTSNPQELIQYFPNAKSYGFSTASGYLDARINLDYFFAGYNPEEKHQFWVFGGVGGMLCFGYSSRVKEWTEYYPIDTKTKLVPAWRVGLEWLWKVSRSTSFVVRGLYATTSSKFDGKELESGSARHFAEFSVGINVHLGNRYGQRHFENCGHNANRYFEVMNGRLAKMHRKAAKEKAKATRPQPVEQITESDSILLFPVDYFYLTDMQKQKLQKMAKHVLSHPGTKAHIHIYPDAGSVGSMEMEFRVTNRAQRVDDYLTKELRLTKNLYTITTHPSEQSPYPRQHIFTLGGIIRYESVF